MGLRLKPAAGGTVEINPANSASNFVLTIPAKTGKLSYSDSATGGSYLPVGTTAQRPSSPTAGMIRFNTTTNNVEVYNGSSWS